MRFKEFLLQEAEEKQKVVKSVLSYTDRDKNKHRLIVGTNARGNFFTILKGEHADFHLSTIMFGSRKGSYEAAKEIKDAIRSTWEKVKDKGPNQRALTLKTMLQDKSSVKNWEIEK